MWCKTGPTLPKYANYALLFIMLGQCWANISNFFIADSAKVTISTGMHNFDFRVLNPD